MLTREMAIKYDTDAPLASTQRRQRRLSYRFEQNIPFKSIVPYRMNHSAQSTRRTSLCHGSSFDMLLESRFEKPFVHSFQVNLREVQATLES